MAKGRWHARSHAGVYGRKGAKRVDRGDGDLLTLNDLAARRAALHRLADVSAQHTPGTVEHACWQMVHAVEALRRLNGRKVARMHRMRPKIEKDGEIGALEYCALHQTDGFTEVMNYGTPELTAEAIVLRHASHFSPGHLAAARTRLEQAGVHVDSDGNIT